MATAQQITEAEYIEGAGGSAETDYDQAAKFDEFRNASAAESQNLIVNVYLEPTSADGTASVRGRLEHLFSCPVDEFTREQIISKVREEYMNVGDVRWNIRIQIRKPGDRGLRYNQAATVRKGVKLAGAPTGEKHGDVEAILQSVNKMLADSNARTEAMLARVASETAKVPQVNPVELILLAQKQASEQFALIAAAVRGPAGAVAVDPATDFMKLLTLMRELKQASGEFIPSAAATISPDDTAAGIIKAVSPMAVPFLQIIAQSMQQKMQAAKATQPAQIAAPAAAPAIPIPETPKTIEPVKDMKKEDSMLFALRDQLGQLADVIATNPDPAAVAGQILENLPEAYDDPLYTLLSDPQWFERMSAVQAKLQPHKEWMTKLKDEILKSFTEDTGAANDA